MVFCNQDLRAGHVHCSGALPRLRGQSWEEDEHHTHSCVNEWPLCGSVYPLTSLSSPSVRSADCIHTLPASSSGQGGCWQGTRQVRELLFSSSAAVGPQWDCSAQDREYWGGRVGGLQPRGGGWGGLVLDPVCLRDLGESVSLPEFSFLFLKIGV